MNAEAENAVKLIFPDGIPDSSRENPDFALYLSRLGSLGIEQLSKEPERINEEKASVVEQTQDLAFSNYKTFIQTAECSREIFRQFKNTEEKLDSLVSKLPEFKEHCQHFSKISVDINTHRRLNSLTLTRNAQLLEMLELPQLMDSCIRNGNYEEALELTSYVRRLGKKHGHIPVISSIVADVESTWIVMKNQLLSQLRSDLQLPSCLQVVGYLRRMEIFTEAELRFKFLQTRDSWFQSLLATIPKNDANQHLTTTIELSRVHLFNILTQYRAIFSDDSPILVSTKDQFINESAIFYSWITSKISQFLTTLEQDLSKCTTNSIDSLLGQSMYFGLSFSRVGVDFRGLMAPIFVKVVLKNFDATLRKATKKFEYDMENFSLNKSQTEFLPHNPDKSETNKPEQPPYSLMQFYPLAEYCNGVLTAFNDLRLCTPVALADIVTKKLEESLSLVAKALLAFYRQEQQAFSSSEKEYFVKFCICFSEVFIPYLQKCLHLLFPPSKLASHIGISVAQVQKDNLTVLNQLEVSSPISHLLPAKMEQVMPAVSIVTPKIVPSVIPSLVEPTEQEPSDPPGADSKDVVAD